MQGCPRGVLADNDDVDIAEDVAKQPISNVATSSFLRPFLNSSRSFASSLSHHFLHFRLSFLNGSRVIVYFICSKFLSLEIKSNVWDAPCETGHPPWSLVVCFPNLRPTSSTRFAVLGSGKPSEGRVTSSTMSKALRCTDRNGQDRVSLLRIVVRLTVPDLNSFEATLGLCMQLRQQFLWDCRK